MGYVGGGSEVQCDAVQCKAREGRPEGEGHNVMGGVERGGGKDESKERNRAMTYLSKGRGRNESWKEMYWSRAGKVQRNNGVVVEGGT